jgi:hypothetical protein
MEILVLIEAIRNSFHGSIRVYTQGSCYHFYKILKSVFTDAEPYYQNSHIVTKINDRFYDITGEVFGDFQFFNEKEHQNIVNNKFGITGYIQCPNCDDIFKCE